MNYNEQNHEYEIEWEAPEYEYYPKNISWFWISIIISLILLIIAFWQKNFLFGLFIVIAEILILFWGNQPPRIIKFKINNKGIYAGEYNFYNFESISDFSSTESVIPDLMILKIDFKNKLKFKILILVPNYIFEEVKNYLLIKNIPETEYEEHFIESLQKILRF